MNFFEKLKGKRTYLFAAAFAVLAVVILVLNVAIPEYAFGVLGALGLGFLRLAIQDISGNKGWKTYVAVVAVAAVAVLQALNFVLPYEAIYSVLGALGVVGVRDAIAKIPA